MAGESVVSFGSEVQVIVPKVVDLGRFTNPLAKRGIWGLKSAKPDILDLFSVVEFVWAVVVGFRDSIFYKEGAFGILLL